VTASPAPAMTSVRLRNTPARLSALFALLSLASIPAAWYATHLRHVNVPEAVGGEAAGGTLFGLIAVVLARKARYRVERTLARVGETSARWGNWLGLLGMCLGLTAALAVAFYGLLLWYE
jgi:hypothetical protein